MLPRRVRILAVVLLPLLLTGVLFAWGALAGGKQQPAASRDHDRPASDRFVPSPEDLASAYQGAAFVAEHGSWNRSKRTGHKVIRVLMKDGVPTGEYEDFMTGFVHDDAHVWGRPVGIAIAHDGSLLVSEDENGTIWRVTYQGRAR